MGSRLMEARVRTELIGIRAGTTRTFTFDVTLYSGQELRGRLESVGFSDVNSLGIWPGASTASMQSA
jgi:hypothetical protein